MDTVTVAVLADALQEPNRPLLTQVLRVLGHDRCRTILADTPSCLGIAGRRTLPFIAITWAAT